MKKKSLYIIIIAALLNACSDTLYENSSGTVAADQADSIAFSLSVTEQADIVYQYGATRSAATDSTLIAANRFTARTLDGDNTYGLQLHRMPLPMVGIHPHTVSSQPHDVSESTRALASDIVKSTADDHRYETFHDSLTIWGYTSTAYTTVNQTTTTEIFSQNVLKKVRGWRTSAHWPYGGGQMKFYAVAPAMEALDLKVTNTPGFSTAPTFTYIVPDNPDEQRDLLYGESDIITNVDSRPRTIGEDDKIVGLNFQHILTAVRFAQGKIPTNVRIKSISLYHIKEKGTYTPGTGWGSVTNSATNGATYTVETNWKSENYTANENTYIKDKNGNDFVLFLMPHTLSGISSNTPEIHIVLEELPYQMDANGDFVTPKTLMEDVPANWKEHTIKASLNGDIWKPGYTVTYKLTIGQLKEGYYLLAENADEIEHDATNSTNGHFTVHSFQNYIDYSSNEQGTLSSKTSHLVNWKIEKYAEQETLPDDNDEAWKTTVPTGLTINTDHYDTGTTDVTCNFTISAQSAVERNHNTILQENSNTHASKIDLANNTSMGESFNTSMIKTANCYIVNRKGTYSFPLIYGNQVTSNSLFVDHNGHAIEHIWIADQFTKNSSPANTYYLKQETISTDELTRTVTNYVWESNYLQAILIWQDVRGLVKNGTLSVTPNKKSNTDSKDNTGMIEFEIDKAEPGNAVIALQIRKKVETYTRATSTDSWPVDPTTTEYGGWETAWTWHIWMTDEVYPNHDAGTTNEYYLTNDNGTRIVTLKDANGNATGKIMPVNLGWKPDVPTFKVYKPRYIWLKLAQEGTTNKTNVRITQHARQDLITGTSTVYQWGRPTALPMPKKVNGEKNVVYNIEGNETSIGAVEASTRHAALALSDKFLYNTAASWGDLASAKPNLWGSSQGNASGLISNKTVYDPCPAGFCVPQGDLFKVMSLNDNGTKIEGTSGANLNIWTNSGNQKSADTKKGAYFYQQAHTTATLTNSVRYSPIFYMPATGYTTVKPTNDIDYVGGTYGVYHTSDAIDSSNGNVYTLWFRPQKGSGGSPYTFFDYQLHGATYDGENAAVAYPNTAKPIRPTGDLPATTSTP